MKHKFLLGGLTLTAFLIGSPAPAQASLAACGDIHVEASAECRLEVEGGCTAKCTPVTFQAACAAELHASCEGTCNGSASLACTGSCDVASCEARCEVSPAEFDCQGECMANADAHCAGECSAAANRGECEASCQATFSGSCSGSCSGSRPEADCEAHCQASCEGSCEAQANVECQVDCQATGFAQCNQRLEGGCEAACTSPDGALFCDGQYVDHGGNLETCITALDAYLSARVDTSASGTYSSECTGNSCRAEAEGRASASCTYAPAVATGAGTFFAGLAALGMTWTRRRRRAHR